MTPVKALAPDLELLDLAENRAPRPKTPPRTTGPAVPVDALAPAERLRFWIFEASTGLGAVDAEALLRFTVESLAEHAAVDEGLEVAVRTAAARTAQEPEYAQLAARLLMVSVKRRLAAQEIHSFSDSIARGFLNGLIHPRLHHFVGKHKAELEAAIDAGQNDRFRFFGLRTLVDRYLLKHPESREILEEPQYFFMRIACALSTTLEEALELYALYSNLEFLPSSPTLFNAGTNHEQLSSCFLVDSPQDDLSDIYQRYADVAQLSKFSGGIGLAYHRVRSRGSLIRSTNGASNGIIPWLRTLDSSVAAVNQGGKRKGACAVYLETWHADIEAFLELRNNTGDEALRTHNLNLANWIPDLFMKRVEEDGTWSLFDPKEVPELPDLYGEAFEQAYLEAETAGLAEKTLPARELYAKMMKTLGETGNGWITFKDRCNETCNQTALPGRTVHLSNLCTEIVEVTSNDETAVCNLGSINLSEHVQDGQVNYPQLAHTVKTATAQLDRVIDLNYYPIEKAKNSNLKWRPVGLGIMGLQDVLFKLGIAFDSDAALKVSREIQAFVYFHALRTSCDRAQTYGAHPNFHETRAAQGDLQPDLWGESVDDPAAWAALKQDIQKYGLRNSLLLAIAPTATIASIAGCYECTEPQVSNLFKRETLSGEFLQINIYLVEALRARGLWTEEIKQAIKDAEGSIQGIEAIPEDVRHQFRTSWELPMRSVIDMAAARGPYLDQSQSLNLFMQSPDITSLSSMYYYAWKQGIKTTYYLRSRPATRIQHTTGLPTPAAAAPRKTAAQIACSLENPESCEACQ